MSKVQIIIEGGDAAEAAANLIALVDRLRGSAAPAPLAEAAAPKSRGGRKAAEPAPATETANDPFATASAAPAAQQSAASSEPAASGATAAASAEPTQVDLEDGDAGEGEPTYDQLSAAMNEALGRVGNDPLKVQAALFAATGAKALKQLTTTGVKGGPIIPGKGAAALAAFEAIGRE